jgi:hypothetical protein
MFRNSRKLINLIWKIYKISLSVLKIVKIVENYLSGFVIVYLIFVCNYRTRITTRLRLRSRLRLRLKPLVLRLRRT